MTSVMQAWRDVIKENQKLQDENAELKARWEKLEDMAERKAKFFEGKNPSDFYFGEQSTWAFIHSLMKEAGKG